MQILIDFLVNNYLWFIIISLILIFALIGYLVDTSEKLQKEREESIILEEQSDGPKNIDGVVESINMDMGLEQEEQQVDKIVLPKIKENEEESTEVLDI